MICPFCKIQLQKIIEKSIHKEKFIRINCDNCNCMFTVSTQNNELLKTTIFVQYDSLTYWFIVDYQHNFTRIMGPQFPEAEKQLNKSNVQHASSWTCIFNINHIINIFPKNAISKLKTILVFQ